MDSAKVFDQALKNTTFSQNALEALAIKIAESPKKDGIITMRTTTDIDGVPFGEPMKVTAAIRDGKIHRDNGPAVVIDDIAMSADGSVRDAKTVLYMQNGVPDRTNGPAVITSNGDMLWMRKGQLHRENGPAALISGKPVFALDGKAMTQEEFGAAMKLGTPGRDWLVEPNTGTMFTGLSTGSPQVVMMKDVAALQTVEMVSQKSVQTAPLPPLAGTAKQQEWGSNIRNDTVMEIRRQLVQEPARAENAVKAISTDKDLNKAQFWIATRSMPVQERAAAVVKAVEQPDKDKMKPFGKYLGGPDL